MRKLDVQTRQRLVSYKIRINDALKLLGFAVMQFELAANPFGLNLPNEDLGGFCADFRAFQDGWCEMRSKAQTILNRYEYVLEEDLKNFLAQQKEEEHDL